MIEIFDDRVEISNPGGLPSGLAPEDFGTKSVVRNPIIASLLNRAEYIERIGTGINRIKKSVKKQGKGTVEFHYDSFFTVIFKHKTQKSSEKSSEKIISILKINPGVSAQEISGQLGITSRAVEKQIAKLKSSGKIKRIGPAKGGHWKVSDQE